MLVFFSADIQLGNERAHVGSPGRKTSSIGLVKELRLVTTYKISEYIPTKRQTRRGDQIT